MRSRVLLVLGLVLALAVGALLGLLSIGMGNSAEVAGHALPSGAGATPFAVGSCFYSDHPGSLRPASCTGDESVFVINAVGRTPQDCAAVADFTRWGAVQRDDSANAVYCVSLLLHTGDCVVLGTDKGAHRVDCGTDRDASRVVRMASTATPASACTDLPEADVWYYRSPSSGQLACLAKDGG
ncbi:LppU/SCO3897 family protein [Sciscionella marina]|uniref:LppU/SCO3897 family protein n=1 Tax=Sciscionella marina TaxID=508770 RepID=UPI000382AD50|nr:hypothetical protein [Sciscionella marina]